MPNLGVVRYGDYQSFVMADIPGLIPGASEGHGLGIRFLRHIERTDLFLHLVDLSGMQEGDPLTNFTAINRELGQYNAELLSRPMLVVFTKLDITEVRDQLPAMREAFAALGYQTFAISAVTGEGTADLVRFVGAELARRRAAARSAETLDSPVPDA